MRKLDKRREENEKEVKTKELVKEEKGIKITNRRGKRTDGGKYEKREDADKRESAGKRGNGEGSNSLSKENLR